MAKVRIDHLDGPVGKDLFEWAEQFDSVLLPEDMEKDIDLLVERIKGHSTLLGRVITDENS